VQQFLNYTLSGLTAGFIYAAFALCLVLIFRATRIVNFGQGAMAMFTTFIAITVLDRTDSYWLALLAGLASGFVLGAVLERTIIRPVETGPEMNAVIVTLGIFVSLVALAALLFGNQLRGYPAAFSTRGITLGDTPVNLTPNNIYQILAVVLAVALLTALFRFTTLGLQMRASAFGQEVARLLGVKVSNMLVFGWALAGLFGSLAGILIASGSFISPEYMNLVIVFGFVSAVLGGLDSFVGAIVGGLLLGLTQGYVSGYLAPELTTLGALVILMAVLLLKPGGLFSSSVARKV
jgi:branched-chain amino acid transport system permease protein